MFLSTVLIALYLHCSLCTAERELVLALEDNFDDFNLSLWKHEITLAGGGNFEFQWYTNNRSNSFVENGVLHIRPTLTKDDIGENSVQRGSLNIWGSQPSNLCTANSDFGCERNAIHSNNYLNPVKSARIRTAESFSFTYGKVEVRAKLPRGNWLWPAIWMLPTDEQYGGWPASGEMVIMKSRGNAPGYVAGGYDTYTSTLQWGVNRQEIFKNNQTTSAEQQQDFTTDFHTFGLVWNETYIGTYLDSESNPILQFPITQSFFERGGWSLSAWNNPWRGRGNNAPFDRRFYLIINLAVGGISSFFPDGAEKPWQNSQRNAGNIFYDAESQWFNTWTQSFQIDSVRVWTYQDNAPTHNLPATSSSLPTSSGVVQGSTGDSVVSALGGVFGALVILFCLVVLAIIVVVCLQRKKLNSYTGTITQNSQEPEMRNLQARVQNKPAHHHEGKLTQVPTALEYEEIPASQTTGNLSRGNMDTKRFDYTGCEAYSAVDQ